MNYRRRLFAASVISVQNSNFVYPSCQNCFSRLLLASERYTCLKCGCLCNAEEVGYRYRLSLEVADSQEVFEVTVFGSCLEAYFGVTANSLGRYIEELNREAGEPEKDASPRVVFRAVETCFIGKKFVFGVKGSGKQDDTSSLRNNLKTDRYPKALTACQMFIPSPELLGCTVIDYLHQYQGPSPIRCNRFWSPGGPFVALGQPSRELSSFHVFGDLGAVQSSCVDGLSSLWLQSFALSSSSSSISCGTATDSTSLISGQTAGEIQKSEDSLMSVQLLNLSVCNPQGLSLPVNKKHAQEKRFHLHATPGNGVAANCEPDSLSSSGKQDCRLLQCPVELGETEPSGKIVIPEKCGPENSLKPLLHRRQSCPLRPLDASSSQARAEGKSQGSLGIWDELPSSESLNEFIAKMEDKRATELSTETHTWGHWHEHFSQLSPRCSLLDESSVTGQSDVRLRKLVEKVDMCKEPVLSCHHSNPLSFCGKQPQQKSLNCSLSADRKEEWNCLTNQHSILCPLTSPAAGQQSTGSDLPSKAGVNQNVSVFKHLHLCSPVKASLNNVESPGAQTKETSARLSCKCVDRLNRTSDLKNSQQLGFTSVVHEKPDKVYEREGELISNWQENHCRGSDSSYMLRGCPNCCQECYNASADLFGASVGGAEVAVGTLSTDQGFSTRKSALTEKCRTYEFMLNESDASPCGLSLHDLSCTPRQKTSTPVANLVHELDPEVASTQDFVPHSQSTPLAGLSQQERLPKQKKSILRELSLNKLSRFNGECEKATPASKKPLVKQLVSKFLQSRKWCQTSFATLGLSIPHQLDINGSPAWDSAEKDSEEWVPPSEKKPKRSQQIALQNQKTFRSRRKSLARYAAECQAMENLIRVEVTSQWQQPTETTVGIVPIHEGAANPGPLLDTLPDLSAFSDGNKSHLSSTSVSFTAPWSPELFANTSQLPDIS